MSIALSDKPPAPVPGLGEATFPQCCTPVCGLNVLMCDEVATALLPPCEACTLYPAAGLCLTTHAERRMPNVEKVHLASLTGLPER